MANASLKVLLRKKEEGDGAASKVNCDAACIASPRKLLRKMLESGSGDWEMVGADGRAVKFHQAVLAEQVPHFRAVISHESTKECANKRIAIPANMDISGKAVEAFLRYIYYQDAKLMASNFKICCDLIRLGHLYEIPALIVDVNEIISKPEITGWKLNQFRVEVLWKLYQDVWLWEEEHPFKKKLVDTIAAIIKMCCKMGSAQTLLPVTRDAKDPLLLSSLMVALAGGDVRDRPKTDADSGANWVKHMEEHPHITGYGTGSSSASNCEMSECSRCKEEVEASPLALLISFIVLGLMLWWMSYPTCFQVVLQFLRIP